MTQEDKELLLKDLSARLPYRVKINCFDVPRTLESISIDYDGFITIDCGGEHFYHPLSNILHKDCLPYLRPMSSMTEEESAELSNIISKWFDKELFYLTEEPFLRYALSRINYSISPLLFDWLNAHHFDYRGLISKGLAIEVTKENNPYKD